MKNVIVASTNPVKMQAALAGMQTMFPAETFTVTGLSAPSGVSDQPASDVETFQGALNRARAAQAQILDADYWVGIEGGVADFANTLLAFAWVVVLSADGMGCSRTATFSLPQPIVTLVRQGVELGTADDIVFGRANSKQANGAVGILTGDVIDRARYYEHAVMLALIPFKNPSLVFEPLYPG